MSFFVWMTPKAIDKRHRLDRIAGVLHVLVLRRCGDGKVQLAVGHLNRGFGRALIVGSVHAK